MSWVMGAVLAVVSLVVAGAIWVRVAPDDPAQWHVDPRSVTITELGGWKIGPEAEAPSPVFAAGPEALLAAVDQVALATARTARLAGAPDEGRITYVTRSAVFGFPDYTTVEAEPAPGGAVLVAAARQRYGEGDSGVNRARLEAWLDRLPAAIDAGPGL